MSRSSFHGCKVLLLAVAVLAGCDGGNDASEPLAVTTAAISSVPNALGSGQSMTPEQWLTSINGLYSLTCHLNGDLVIRRIQDAVVLWSSQTRSTLTAATCSMQTNGDFVVRNAASTVMWHSGTVSTPGARLTLQNDGVAVILRSDGSEAWSSRALAGNTMASNSQLRPPELISSSNGRYRLVLQPDGNLVLSRVDTEATLWSSQTSSTTVTLVMQSDGNLVLRPSTGGGIWSSGTAGNTGARLVLQDDGDLVIVRADGTVVWRTNTAQGPWRSVFGFAGSGTRGQSVLDGRPPLEATFTRPTGIARTENGNFFILDGGNNRIARVPANGGSITQFDTPGVDIFRSSKNVLVNPSAEDGLTGWTVPAGNPGTWGSEGVFRGCVPPACEPMSFEGDNYFRTYDSVDAELVQVVNIPSSGDVDEGLVDLVFTGYVRSMPTNSPGRARVVIEYLDGNDNPLNPPKGFDSGFITSTTTWARVFQKITAPVGSRRARVRLIADNVPDVKSPVYFDGLSFIKQGHHGLHNPQAIINGDSAGSPSDSVIIADTYNHRIVKISQQGGTLVSLAGTMQFPGSDTLRLNCPKGLARAANGDIYIADYANHRVMRLRSGTMTVAAGTGVEGWSGNDGPATSAKLSYPSAVAVSAANNLYIADRGNSVVRKVDLDTGIITRYAGASDTGLVGFSGNGGPATSAMLSRPDGLATSDGNVYIADSGNHVIRRVRSGTITEFAAMGPTPLGIPRPNGNTGDGGGALGARFDWPRGLLVHPTTGDVYITDQNNHRVRVTGCSDRNACTGTETYSTSSGSCSAGTPLVVNDNNPCTTDTCNTSTGAIAHVAVPTDDGDPCTDDSCSTTLGVRHVARAAGSSCSDGDPCTVADACLAGSAVCRGTPVVIPDDGNPCTAGHCDSGTGEQTQVPVNAGTPCGSGLLCDGASRCEGPPPVLVAPQLDGNRATPFAERVRFLHQGFGTTPPIQTGVTPGAIDEKRVALVSGRVVTPLGEPFSNVRVSVPDAPGLGQTLTRADGRYDLVVNGGASVTLRAEKTGSFSADRVVPVQWLSAKAVEDIVLKQADTKASDVTLGSSAYQVAESSKSRDSDGERTAVVLVPPGTGAKLRFSNGNTQDMTTLKLRMTEYTVGEQGPAAMPAPIPPSTAYTYAVEVSADQAVDAGAESVQFTKPIAFYVDNYLRFPAGERVPAGYYDKAKKAWVASKNGIVLMVTAVNNGVADLDATGDGKTSQTEMDAIGAGSPDDVPMTLEERRTIGQRFRKDQSFWRVPMKHLTPWDFNWPKGPPPCEGAICPGAMGSAAGADAPICSTETEGSIIECEAQGLGERVDVAGTPFSLNYRSTREPGYKGNRQIRLELTGPEIHSKLQSIEVVVSIAGQTIFRRYPAAPNLKDTISWDGLDGFGRPVVGSEIANVTITSVFQAVYYSAAQFAEFSATVGSRVVAADRANNAIRFSRTSSVELLGLAPKDGWSLGGWTLSPHHFLDVRSAKLFLGDGSVRKVDPDSYVVRHIAGNGSESYGADGASALDTGFDTVNGFGRPGMAVAPNGDIYIADPGHRVVRVISAADGKIRTVAGIVDNSYPCANGQTPGVGDGLLATAARVFSPNGVALGPDGSLFVTDRGSHSIRRVTPDGRIQTVAGGNTCVNGSMPNGFQGNGVPATAALLSHPSGIAVAPDGTVVFVDQGNHSIRKISPDGIIWTVAGNGGMGSNNREARENLPAATVNIGNPTDVAIGSDGTLYIANDYELQSVQADGILRILSAPFDTDAFTIEGVPISQQPVDIALRTLTVDNRGRIFFNDSDSQRRIPPNTEHHDLIRMVDTNGLVTTISAGRWDRLPFDGAVALQRGPGGAEVITAGLADNLLVFHGKRIYALDRPATRGVASCENGAAVYLIPRGDEGYCFDGSGRHLSTLDLRTGARRYTFVYHPSGKLRSITGAAGSPLDVTASGSPTVITAPHGQQTILNPGGNGYLASIQDAAGGVGMSHRADGLLETYTDRRGTAFSFGYDETGLLRTDRGAVGTSFDSTQRLDPFPVAGGRRVEHTTPNNRKTMYEVTRDAANVLTQTTTEPEGTRTVRKLFPDATETVVTSDGTETTVVRGPMARFGMRRPMATSVSTKLPSGQVKTITQSQEATFSDPTNPMSLVSETTRRSEGGGAPWVTAYDAATSTEVTTSPVGRRTTRVMDDHGRPGRLAIDGLTPIDVGYDGGGRLQTITQGARVIRFGYETDAPDAGYLETVTNPLNEVTTYDRDVRGRSRFQTLGGQTTELNWDGNDNLVLVKPPGRPSHVLGYSPFDRLTSYDPPAIPGISPVRTTYEQTLDRVWLKETRQGVLAGTADYEPNTNRVDKITRSGRVVDYTYYPLGSTANFAAPGRIKTIAGPLSVNLGFKYDGRLTKEVAWSGGITGSVAWQHDNLFQRTEEKVTGSSGTRLTKFGYDADGLLTCVSPSSCTAPGADAFTVTRNGPHGMVTGTALGNVTETRTYNGFGEVETIVAKYGATEIVNLAYNKTTAPRDLLGRVKEVTEVIQGTTRVVGYTYDVRGQLTDVKVGGVESEHIDYDGNGNRSAYRSPVLGSIVPTHNDQDRLGVHGPLTMTYRANGELATRADSRTGVTSTFVYDEMGNLLSVSPSSGSLIEYLVDGQNRRVAKKVNGAIVKRWLYRDQLNPVAELDGAGALVAQFVYGTRPNVPDVVMRADGSVFRVISDQLGSPRYVVNVATGAMVFRASFTAFGEPTGTIAGLDWMPFGFAGGLYDPDTKLLRFGVRDYDPAVGRWLSRDPIRFRGGQANLYAYVGNDPVNRRDPTGYIINYDGVQELVGGGLVGLGIYALVAAGTLSNPVGWALIIVGGAMALHAMYGDVDTFCDYLDKAEEDIDTKIKAPRQRQAEQMRELDQLQRDQECGENMSMEGCGP